MEFTVNSNPASAATDRFRIVFFTQSVLPVTFTSLTAIRLQKDISVKWKTENEINMATYIVERSADPVHFSAAATIAVLATQQGLPYKWTDLNADSRAQFYRIKGVSINGNITYSSVVKVAADEHLNGEIKVNSSAGGGEMIIDITNAVKNKYLAEIFDYSGRVLGRAPVEYNGGSASFRIPINYLPAGAYYVKLSSAEQTYSASFIKP